MLLLLLAGFGYSFLLVLEVACYFPREMKQTGKKKKKKKYETASSADLRLQNSAQSTLLVESYDVVGFISCRNILWWNLEFIFPRDGT